jgi:16S rRNA (adenine1518-N6/adenine1519-N6)-dimethyltransferase
MNERDPKSILQHRGLHPKKSFGQNFLRDPHVTASIAAACVPNPGAATDVLEWGAGTGALTRALLERGAHVTAVERDRDLIPVLAETFASEIADGSLTLVEGDAKTFEIKAAFRRSGALRVLAGNLPYQLTGFLLEAAVEAASSIDLAVFMMQKEVEERISAAPGTKAYGALTIFVGAQFKVRLLRTVSPACFFPAPAVFSSVVSLTPAPRAKETHAFRKLVKAAFMARRKTLRNAWSGIFASEAELIVAAEKSHISLTARGETLAVEDYARIAALLEIETPH